MTAAKRKPIAETVPGVSIELDRQDFLKALNAVLPAVERRNTIPILGGIHCAVETGCMTLTATNLDQFLSAKVEVAADRNWTFVLCEPKGLAALLKLIDRDRVVLTIGEESTHLKPAITLTAGTTAAEFHSMPPDDFPVWAHFPTPTVTLILDGVQLGLAIERTAFAISTEEIRYYLNGLFLHYRKGRPWFAATDGHRLALCAIEPGIDPHDILWGDEAIQDFKVIIPAPAVAMLRAMAARGQVEIRLWDRRLEITQGDYTLNTKLIDGIYPDIDRVIPTDHLNSAILPTYSLIQAEKRAETLCRQKTKSLKIVIEPATVTVQMRDNEGGKVTDILDLAETPVFADADGKQIKSGRFEHGVNGKYLAEILASFGSAVRYKWADPASPLVIHDADAATQDSAIHLVVLMPMLV
jgi:DNA polymerase-3 subunit beta